MRMFRYNIVTLLLLEVYALNVPIFVPSAKLWGVLEEEGRARIFFCTIGNASSPHSAATRATSDHVHAKSSAQCTLVHIGPRLLR